MIPRTAKYLVQYACFACKKSFKRATLGSEAKCPHCGALAHEMGRNFRAPRQRDYDQWRKVRILYDGGVRFWGTLSGDLGKFPDTCDEAIEFINRNRAILARHEANYRKHLAVEVERGNKMREKGRKLRLKRNAEVADGKTPGTPQPPH